MLFCLPAAIYAQEKKSIPIKYQPVSPDFYVLMNKPLSGKRNGLNVQKTVSGIVTDAQTGNTLPGVNILVEGTSSGTATDSKGHYSLSVPSLQDTLRFTYIGYQTKTVPIDGRTTIDVTLKPTVISGNQLVVVGFGKQKKKDVTGAISTISEEDIKDYPAVNVSEVITGKAPGVYVAPRSGQPGQTSMVRIRGFGTVNNNKPLYVVDGQPISDINNLNPSDIKNIQILKDASATAIYGSRGSNGVILVTTKEGTSGKTVASFNSHVAFNHSYKPVAMQNSDQYYNYITMAYKNAGQTLSPKFKQQYERGINTNWWNAVNRTGLTQNYDLSVSSGGENSQTYFGVGYKKNNGSIITTKYKDISLRLNSKYDISSKITVGTHLGAAKNNQVDTNPLVNFGRVINPDPFTPVINPNVPKDSPNYTYNKYAPPEWAFNPNPVATLRNNINSSDKLNFYGNVYGRYNIYKGLDYYVQYNFEDDNNTVSLFQPKFHAQFDDLNLANQTDKYRDQTYLTNNTITNRNYGIEQRLHYKKSLKSQTFDVMAAMKYQLRRGNTINAFKKEAPGNNRASRVFEAATLGDQVGGGIDETSILSYLGRINYSLLNRYLVTINFRADGSSRFSPGNKWGYFPSFSLGWRISNERFFENAGIGSVISKLKIRAGWGQTGNQDIFRNAPYTLLGTSATDIWYFGDGFSQGYVPTNEGNPDIRWETSQQTNVGLDAGLFSNKLLITFNYYIKKTKDMLLRVPLPNISGYPNNPYSNAGDMKNTGFGLSVDYNNTSGAFNYSIGVNLSKYNNKVTYLGNGGIPLVGSVSKTIVGGPISRFYGYKYLGIFQNQQEIDNYLGPKGNKVQPDAKPGDFKFADLNDDGIINDQDRTFIGNPHPDLIYGFHLRLNWKNVDLRAFFQGTLGNDLYNGIKTLGTPGFQNALAAAYTKAWKKGEDNTKATYPRITLKNTNDNFRTSSWWVEDGSYLRLQNLQLGYNIPASFIQKSGVLSSLRIYLAGKNLFTWTAYSGLDPSIGTTDPLNLGYDPIRYPASRSFIIGINAKF
jgi:TonB-linked SusC/RagA family outer membrane protein